jgi:tyrosine-specific transport protein
MRISNGVYPIATLSGTIIGVGFFALPYITSKVGFWIMLGYFFVLGILVTLVHLFFGELSLKTPDYKRLPGFAKFHLGNWGERIALISTILGTFGAILAYLIVGGEFLTELVLPILGGNSIIWTIFYWAVGSILIFFGIKIISKVEIFDLIAFLMILILIFLKGFSQFKTTNLFPCLDFSQIFLPYGPILFSLWGAALIPEVEEMLGENKRILPKIILISILIPIIFYLLFIFSILGISGQKTTESALIGLRDSLGQGIVLPMLLFGILTTFTSFIALGLTLKKVFWYDLKIEKNLAFLITCLIPIILFLIGVKHFIPIISFVGGVMLGIDGILILLMYRKIKPKNCLVYPLFLILFGGIIYEIIYFFR